MNENSGYIYRPRLYINRKKPIVTYVLIGLTVLIFLADEALNLFAGERWLTLYGIKWNEAIILWRQWWRFVTPLFLHGGLMHIVFNMYALAMWGRHLEALLGRARYIGVYFFAGILGCAASFAFSSAFSVGASGAIFGLFGALLYFRKEHKALFTAVFGMQVLVIIGINIANGFLVSNIDNFGHLGGLAGGFLAACALGLYGQGMPMAKRLLYCAACFAALAGLIIIGYWGGLRLG